MIWSQQNNMEYFQVFLRRMSYIVDSQICLSYVQNEADKVQPQINENKYEQDINFKSVQQKSYTLLWIFQLWVEW